MTLKPLGLVSSKKCCFLAQPPIERPDLGILPTKNRLRARIYNANL
jgi:hypothetical protein